MPESEGRPYDGLTPEVILDALDSIGLRTDGGMLALNSYENRVYQIGLQDEAPVVAKFYRANRWSDAAIEEEHHFSIELQSAEIPVVAPMVIDNRTLHRYAGFRFAVFPRRGGRWPDLESPDNLGWLGRFLARIHQIGASRPFSHRASITPERLGLDSISYLLDSGTIPVEIEHRYRGLTSALMERIEEHFADVRPALLRVHGDCHPGNILWTDQGPHFVDMDDCANGPAIQDIWMLLSGDRAEMAMQLSCVHEGYEMFRPLNPAETALIEPLRTLRMIHYAAWLARRWADPAFPKAFTWFGTPQYWQEHLSQLEQQLQSLNEPPIPVY